MKQLLKLQVCIPEQFLESKPGEHWVLHTGTQFETGQFGCRTIHVSISETSRPAQRAGDITIGGWGRE